MPRVAGDNRKFTPGRGGEARGNRRVWRFARTDGECLAGCKILVQPIADRRIILDDQDGTRDGVILPATLEDNAVSGARRRRCDGGYGARPSQAAPGTVQRDQPPVIAACSSVRDRLRPNRPTMAAAAVPVA